MIKVKVHRFLTDYDPCPAGVDIKNLFLSIEFDDIIYTDIIGINNLKKRVTN